MHKERTNSRQGSVSAILAIVMPVMIAFAGLAIDLGNMYLTKTRLQAATDAAALAGSLELPYDPDLDKGRVQQAVVDMLHQNFPAAELVSLSPGTEVRCVVVRSRAVVRMMLMSVLGIGDKIVEAEAAAGFNKLEVVFAIDNSGSMKGTPIDMVKAASRDLVDLIMPYGSTPSAKIGLVPFRGKVRVDADAVDGVAPGCRNVDGSLNTGIHESFMDQYYALPYYYRRYYVDLDTCSDQPPVLALSDDRETIIDAVNSQTATGSWSGTVISEGIKWARHVLTPEAPYDQAGSSDEYRKIMILLTDGDTEDGKCGGPYVQNYEPNNYWTNAYYGMGDDKSHCNDGGVLNQHMLDEAQAAKDAGIEIFTIRFGTSDNVDINLMKEIASSKPGTDDHYFDAPSVYDIDGIFKQIGRQLGWRLLR